MICVFKNRALTHPYFKKESSTIDDSHISRVEGEEEEETAMPMPPMIVGLDFSVDDVDEVGFFDSVGATAIATAATTTTTIATYYARTVAPPSPPPYQQPQQPPQQQLFSGSESGGDAGSGNEPLLRPDGGGINRITGANTEPLGQRQRLWGAAAFSSSSTTGTGCSSSTPAATTGGQKQTPLRYKSSPYHSAASVFLAQRK